MMAKENMTPPPWLLMRTFWKQTVGWLIVSHMTIRSFKQTWQHRSTGRVERNVSLNPKAQISPPTNPLKIFCRLIVNWLWAACCLRGDSSALIWSVASHYSLRCLWSHLAARFWLYCPRLVNHQPKEIHCWEPEGGSWCNFDPLLIRDAYDLQIPARPASKIGHHGLSVRTFSLESYVRVYTPQTCFTVAINKLRIPDVEVWGGGEAFFGGDRWCVVISKKVLVCSPSHVF